MKIQYQNKNKRYLLIIGIVIGALLIGLIIYVVGFKGALLGWSPLNNMTRNYGDAPTQDQLRAGENIKKQTEETSKSGEDPNAVGSDRPPTPTVDPNGGKDVTGVRISSINQNDGKLQIRTLISSIVSSGTCTLVLQKDTSVITRTVEIQALSSSATCRGFDIPLSEASDGVWRATLTFENDELKGSETKDITVI